jgi:hypothetical protein
MNKDLPLRFGILLSISGRRHSKLLNFIYKLFFERLEANMIKDNLSLKPFYGYCGGKNLTEMRNNGKDFVIIFLSPKIGLNRPNISSSIRFDKALERFESVLWDSNLLALPQNWH